MPKVDRYVGWWLSDGLQMLAFEAELAHLLAPSSPLRVFECP